MRIFLARILRAIKKDVKGAIKRLGIFFSAGFTVYIQLYDLWPFHEHPLRRKSHFSILT